jgi:7-carboxy-7-deazaguanine synthase
MFGKNPVMKQVPAEDGGWKLRVVKGSPFYTIQGEGPFMGHPSVFIRLHGCNLRCWFCDTEFSDPSDPEWDVVRLARVAYDECKFKVGQKADLVVITGGEPMRQNIYMLVQHLIRQGLRVQIETAGTLWVTGLEHFTGPANGHRLTIVCSPKTPVVHDMIKLHASAFKYVIGTDTTVDEHGYVHANTQIKGGDDKPLARPHHQPIYLSPMDEYDEKLNEANRRRVARLCMKHGYIAGVQMHKLMEINEP